ncbi:MAG: hypothetical protein R2748_28730 [Bryobacterales bacterium]
MRLTILTIALACCAAAQTTVAPSTETPGALEKAGGYTITNSYEVGYRFADVSGNRDVYRSAVNYGNGMRLLEGSLRVHSEDGKSRFLDEFSFHSLGAATDPYQSHTARAEKHGLYRYDMRTSLVRYFNALPSLWQGEHALDAERMFQTHELTLRPGSRFEILLGYDRNSQSGPGFSSAGIPNSTGALDTGSFLRYRTDLRRQNNNYRFGTSFRAAGLAVTAMQSFDNYKEDTVYTNGAGFPSNVANIQGVTSLTRSDPFHGNTPVTMVAIRTEKEHKVGFHGRFVYSGGRRNAALDENLTAFDSQTSLSTTRQTYIVGDASRRQGSGDFTVTLTPNDTLTLTNTSSVSSTRISGGAQFVEVSAFTNQYLDFEDLSVRFVTNATEASVRLDTSMSVYGAYRYTQRTTRTRTALEFPGFAFGDPLEEIDNKVHTWAVGHRLTLPKNVRTSFDFEAGRADRPLTPVSDRKFYTNRLRVQWRGRGATVTGNMQVKQNNNPTSLVSYSSNSAGGGVHGSWADPGSRFTLDGGYQYLHLDTAAGIYNLLAPVEGGASYARSYYTSNLHTGSFGLRVVAHERVTLYAGYSIAKDTGDGRTALTSTGDFAPGYPVVSSDGKDFRVSFPLTYQSPRARISVKFREKLWWNFGWQRYDYDERFTGVQNYAANTGYTSLSWSF